MTEGTRAPQTPTVNTKSSAPASLQTTTAFCQRSKSMDLPSLTLSATATREEALIIEVRWIDRATIPFDRSTYCPLVTPDPMAIGTCSSHS